MGVLKWSGILECVYEWNKVRFWLLLPISSKMLTAVTLIFFLQYYLADKWASTRQNLSSGFNTKRDSNQSPQLQRLARKLKFPL